MNWRESFPPSGNSRSRLNAERFADATISSETLARAITDNTSRHPFFVSVVVAPLCAIAATLAQLSTRANNTLFDGEWTGAETAALMAHRFDSASSVCATSASYMEPRDHPHLNRGREADPVENGGDELLVPSCQKRGDPTCAHHATSPAAATSPRGDERRASDSPWPCLCGRGSETPLAWSSQAASSVSSTSRMQRFRVSSLAAA